MPFSFLVDSFVLHSINKRIVLCNVSKTNRMTIRLKIRRHQATYVNKPFDVEIKIPVCVSLPIKSCYEIV